MLLLGGFMISYYAKIKVHYNLQHISKQKSISKGGYPHFPPWSVLANTKKYAGSVVQSSD